MTHMVIRAPCATGRPTLGGDVVLTGSPDLFLFGRRPMSVVICTSCAERTWAGAGQNGRGLSVSRELGEDLAPSLKQHGDEKDRWGLWPRNQSDHRFGSRGCTRPPGASFH
jgi:hypothetical protein